MLAMVDVGTDASAHEGWVKLSGGRCHLWNDEKLEGQMEVLMVAMHECGACHWVRCRPHPLQATVQKEVACSAWGLMYSKIWSKPTLECARKLTYMRCTSG